MIIVIRRKMLVEALEEAEYQYNKACNDEAEEERVELVTTCLRPLAKLTSTYVVIKPLVEEDAT